MPQDEYKYLSHEFINGFNEKGKDYTFWNPKKELIEGVAVNPAMGPAEVALDQPTLSYNPGDRAAVFYSGFQQ